MTNFVEIPVIDKNIGEQKRDREILHETLRARKTIHKLIEEEKHREAMERVVDSLKIMHDFSDFSNMEFRAVLISLLFDITEIHYALKDYKQSEKELDVLFKLLDPLTRKDPARFGAAHILAMELSTRILRSRRKTIDLLAKQQQATGLLYEKVASGVASATDKLVDSLCRLGELQAAAGDYKASLKFYAEAIKFSKRRTGRVTRKEIKMTIDMAQVMMRIRSMRPRAKRLLAAVLPHAIALETIELEEDILALIEIIDADILREPKLKAFLHKISLMRRKTPKEKISPEARKIVDTLQADADEKRELEKEEKKRAKKQKKEKTDNKEDKE